MTRRCKSIMRAFGSRSRAAGGFPRLKAEDGSTLVEYAVVFILFMTVLFGIAGFGQALYVYHFVGNAAREATRWASVNGSACATDKSCAAPAGATDVANYVSKTVPLGVDPNLITVTTTWPSKTGVCQTTNNAPGCAVQVQVSYTFNFAVPLVHSAPLSLSSTSEMTITH